MERGGSKPGKGDVGKGDSVEITVNGDLQTVPEGTTIAELLDELDLRTQYIAVECNLAIGPRNRPGSAGLQPRDRVEVVTLVGGG